MNNTPDIVTLARVIEHLIDKDRDFDQKAYELEALVNLEIITVRQAIDLALEYLTE